MTAVLTRKMFHRCSHLRPNIRSWSSSNNSTNKQPDPGMVDGRNAPSDFTASCAVVYRDFLTPAEGELLTQDILSRMKR